MRFCSIASGSSGNCIYIGSDNHHILVDAGISCKRITEGLKDLEIKPEELEGIMITHEHSDHIQGIGVLARKYHIPLYGTAGTIDAVRKMKSLGNIPEDCFRVVLPDDPFEVGDLKILPMRTSHDAADPCAYRVDCGKKSAAVVTDLGTYTPDLAAKVKNLDVLLLEANHDIRMLEAGPYPYPLKRRILGDFGHLSNERSGKLLNELLHDDMKHIFLGHLSKENNFPELAYETIRLEIKLGHEKYSPDDFRIEVAKRDVPSAKIEF